MTKLHVLTLTTLVLLAAQAAAQDPAKKVEPDFSLVNLPTTRSLAAHKSSFRLTHRFTGDLRRESSSQLFSDLFTLDNGSVIGLEYRYALTNGLQAGIHRSGLDKTIEFFGKYDAIRQSERQPVSVSIVASVEGLRNFRSTYQPGLALPVSRTVGGRAAVYAVPTWVHHEAGDARTTLVGTPSGNSFFVGVGGRVAVLPTVFVVGEIAPRVGGLDQDRPQFAFGLEKTVGLHLFQLNFGNGFATTPGRMSFGGAPRNLHVGFNLVRRF